MSSVVVQRPARRAIPAPVTDDLVLQPPPAPAAAGAMGWWAYLLPVLGAGGAMVFALINPKPVYLVAAGLFLVASVATGVGMYLQQRTGQRRRLREERERYLEHVDRVRQEAREVARLQREEAGRRHPAPDDLWTVAASAARVWERRPGDGDFLQVRVGTAARPLARRVRVDTGRGPLAQLDPVCAHAAHRLVARCSLVDGMPVTLDLAQAGVVGIAGDRSAARSLARALVCQAAAFHKHREQSLLQCFRQ